jgi:hypothetical protein
MVTHSSQTIINIVVIGMWSPIQTLTMINVALTSLVLSFCPERGCHGLCGEKLGMELDFDYIVLIS